MKNLIIFTDSYPYNWSHEQFIDNELKYLNSKFKISFVPLFKSSSNIKTEIFGEYTVYTPVFESRSFMKIIKRGFSNKSPLNIAALFKLSHLKKITQLLKQVAIYRAIYKRKDLMELISDSENICYFYWGTNSLNILNSIEPRAKIVARFHGFDLYEEDVRTGNDQVFRESVIKRIDYLLFVSEHGLNYLKSKSYQTSSQNFVLSRLGTEDYGEQDYQRDEVIHIVSCGYVKPVKRFDLIVETLSYCKNQRVLWTHIGGGEELGSLVELSKKLSSNIEVNFLGSVSNKEILNFYKNNKVDLFLNVSSSEGVPVSIMEAMSFGIPIFATDVGGTSEIVGESCGRLLEVNFSCKDLMNQIVTFCSSDLTSIRRNSRTVWQEKSNRDKNNSELAKLFQEI